MDGFNRHSHHDPIERLVLHEPTPVPLMADGGGIAAFLKRTCLGLNMFYFEDCSHDRRTSGTLSHGGTSAPILAPPSCPHTGQISDYLAPELHRGPPSPKIEGTEAMLQMLHPRLSPVFNLGRQAADSSAAAAVAEEVLKRAAGLNMKNCDSRTSPSVLLRQQMRNLEALCLRCRAI